ncbi:hypothetical protein ABB37_06925 [Leptomonas pyrrhocoris]|uniref:Tyrosine specific protein phosphatases domain-containing protein n=1 Tax=Leptomonas pyrrhocoris TaxID=157538 RepID=A0A0M9FWS0_LEPPY|nr:hypothetical protein ABB37_06925 [Leptomonas pyrrhocoris]XP_015655988.1 hypothetical protein ABB37_06925 [Leptomonas pyrrhocoris]KPA77548.1 hypothetical protein ABB37_06925 [Leptomonas pyrrhocoris]KPA77549.1 hypothetical protein ABB37_06925 [Leptomonas pyrrhocoris]|eukprot:XP_015655987.1 hypothetical protein ABB37_06925 [Leptomonas pyrrhocoris]
MDSHTFHGPGDVNAEDDLVASLRAFLHTWTERQQHAVSTVTESVSPSDGRGDSLSSNFPPPLRASLPRSFRPCEMVPAVYLGSWQDVGGDVAALIQRLQQATSCSEEVKRESPARLAAPQQMALLVRACPLSGVSGPQLELHVARPRKCGSRRTPNGLSAAGRRLTTMTKAAPSISRPAATTGEASVSVHDVEVTHLGLTDLYKRVCAALGSDSCSPSSATSSPQNTLMQWLCPDGPPSMCRGAIPPEFSPGEWDVCVGAVREVLLGDYAACMESVPATWRDVYCYWRLVLPIFDAPSEPIQQYFAMTTLLLHAALSLSAHSNYSKWLGAERSEESNVGTTPVNGEDVQGGRVAAAAAAAVTALPCVVVHCHAGKSRSVSFVAAFLLQEWMMCYRVAHAPSTVGTRSTPAGADGEHANNTHSTTVGGAASSILQVSKTPHSITARRLVDTVMAHLRSRRLCVDVNIGFDAQLHAMVHAFIDGL